MDEQIKKILLDNFLRWAVFAEIEAKCGCTTKKFNKLIAVFYYPFEAEDYIKKVLPPENYSCFKVVDLQN